MNLSSKIMSICLVPPIEVLGGGLLALRARTNVLRCIFAPGPGARCQAKVEEELLSLGAEVGCGALGVSAGYEAGGRNVVTGGVGVPGH
jgi:hypothetical protein